MKKKILKTVIGLSCAAAFAISLASCDTDTKQANSTTNTTPTTTPNTTTTTSTTTTTVAATKYKVQFDSNRGSAVDTIEVEENTVATKPANPTRNDLEFDGWYLDGQLYDFTKPVTSDIKLTAKWKGVTVDLGGLGLSATTTYNELFTFKDSYLAGDSAVFNKDLALFLFGASAVNDGNSRAAKYFTDLGFDSAVTYPKEITEYHDISYTIAKKAVEGSTYVVVSVRGVGYSSEWASNFDLGLEGDHQGFTKAAETVLEDVFTTVGELSGDVKLALTGYSRGGAVANLLADKLFNLEEKIIDDKNIYTYTFEAPKGILKGDRDIAYKNVFNVINEADLVTAVAPEQFGFARCGMDVDIYNENVDKLLLDYDAELVLNKFTPIGPDSYEKETQVKDFVIAKLLSNYDGYDENVKLNTREKFVNNYVPSIQFIFTNIIFGIKDTTKAKITTDISEMASSGWTGISQLLGIVSDASALHDFLVPYLTEDGLVYDDAALTTACTKVVGLIGGPGSFLLAYAMGESKGTLVRTIEMHFPIVNYILLENYSAK